MKKENIKKIILAMAVIAISTASLQAQKKTALSIAVNAGIPTTTGLSFSYGADIQADFPVASDFKITGSAGFQDYTIKGGGSFGGIIPILAGAKINLGSNKLYGHAQLGAVISTESGGGAAFGYAPSVGYYISPNFDASIKYLAYSKSGFTTGSINLRLAYSF